MIQGGADGAGVFRYTCANLTDQYWYLYWPSSMTGRMSDVAFRSR